MNTFTSYLSGSDGEDVPVSEIHHLLNKMHEFHEKALSKWVSDTANALPFFLSTLHGKVYEVWASQFPFLHTISTLWGKLYEFWASQVPFLHTISNTIPLHVVCLIIASISI